MIIEHSKVHSFKTNTYTDESNMLCEIGKFLADSLGIEDIDCIDYIESLQDTGQVTIELNLDHILFMNEEDMDESSKVHIYIKPRNDNQSILIEEFMYLH